MSLATISTASLEWVRVRVQAYESGALVDPHLDTVKMAFLASGTPTAPDWKTAQWETDATEATTKYFARCLVGPGGTVVLAADIYTVWVQITDSPEIPVLRAGRLVVQA